MVFFSHAIALTLLISLALAGKIDGFWWLALAGVAVCLVADGVVWVRTLAAAGQMRQNMQLVAGASCAGTGASTTEMLAHCLERMGKAEAQLEAEQQRVAELEASRAAQGPHCLRQAFWRGTESCDPCFRSKPGCGRTA